MTRNRNVSEWVSVGLKFAILWLALGLVLVFFYWPGPSLPRLEWIVVILFGPPLYVLGEWLMPRLWIDESDDGKSEVLATIKRLWRFFFAVACTGAFFALIGFGIPWLAAKL